MLYIGGVHPRTIHPLAAIESWIHVEALMQRRACSTPEVSALKRNRAFTLVELLVVIAIIGVLIGLLLPAVQAAREAARRSSCQNNFKQIGIGLLTFENSKKAFPAGYSYFNIGDERCWGWGTLILPFLEQTSLYDQLAPESRKLHDVCIAGAPQADKDALQTRISTYRCPSDATPTLNTLQSFGYSQPFEVATSNYIGSAGSQALSGSDATYPSGYAAPYKDFDSGGMLFGIMDQKASVPGRGPLGIKINDVLDGTSKTLLTGERCGRASTNDKAAAWVGIGRADDYGPAGTCRALGRPIFLQNGDYLNATDPQNASKGFSSLHPGGCLYGYADGSVRWLADAISATNRSFIANRRDGKSYDID
jgi:prepilin-type N-terminal cleavage/methylation domain-containing protein